MNLDKIDFTVWTDAQLEVAVQFPRSAYFADAYREVQRRKAAGLTDGSIERVNSLLKRS